MHTSGNCATEYDKHSCALLRTSGKCWQLACYASEHHWCLLGQVCAQFPLPVSQSCCVSVPLMNMTKLSVLLMMVAKGQYWPLAAVPSGSHRVESTSHPGGFNQSLAGVPDMGVPVVTLVGVLVAAQPAHSS